VTTSVQYLDFEAPLEDLERRVDELSEFPGDSSEAAELRKLRRKLTKQRKSVYRSLTPWQTVQVARHPARPTALDYIEMVTTDFTELHGDRGFADDPAIVGGLARLGERTIVVIGHQKGHTSAERVERNFGMPRPEGFRKALRLMRLAERFEKPVLTLIDTPGAYPGVGAEERGQAEAIARNICEMAALRVPIVVAITGEGMSGGALAIGLGDAILMQQHAIFAVISPEGCASILWQDADKAQAAADALRITAPQLAGLGIVDTIVREPLGGAHRAPKRAAIQLKKAIEGHLDQLTRTPIDEVLEARYEKYHRLGLASLS